MHRTRCAVASLVALGALGVPAGHATSRIDLTGPNVVRYGSSTVVAGTREIVAGSRTSTGGCAFTRATSLRPGESASVVELAYDPDTCRSLVAVAQDDALPAPADGTEGTTSAEATAGSAAGAPETVSALAAFGRFRAYEWSWFDEPVRWLQGCDVEDPCPPLPPVNTVKNTIEWTPDGSCAVAPGTTGRAESATTWFTTTGWESLRNDFTHSPDPIPCHIDMYSNNVNHFQNQEFCAVVGGVFGGILGGILGFVAETDTYYEPNRVRGDENATAFFTVSWRKDGLCNSLLQFKNKTQSIRIG